MAARVRVKIEIRKLDQCWLSPCIEAIALDNKKQIVARSRIIKVGHEDIAVLHLREICDRLGYQITSVNLTAKS